MAIQSSGPVYLTDLQTEFGGSSSPIYLGTYYNGGGRVPSNNTNVPATGAINLGHFYNAVNRLPAIQTFDANTTETTINVSTLSGYVAGITDVTIYVSSNVYVYSTNTATPALTISGATAGDTVTLVNNGVIMGKGGDGAPHNGYGHPTGYNGGPALSIGSNIRLTNNSYIGGGGGGGGANVGGGGAGGGNGGYYSNQAGGSGGGPGASGASAGGGGGGGRIMPGVGGTGGITGGGGGAGGGGACGARVSNDSGGNGGSAGAAGGNGYGGTYNLGGGGGGWGAVGGNGAQGGGGAGGKAINLNGSTITYLTTGTIYGAVS